MSNLDILGKAVGAKHAAAITALPIKPLSTVIDNGLKVVLLPYDQTVHAEPLWRALNGTASLGHPAYDHEQLVWQFLWGAPASVEEFKTRMSSRADGPDSSTWVIVLKQHGHLFGTYDEFVGTVSLIASSPANLKVELGFIVVSTAYQGTPVTSSATYLLAWHVFNIGYMRLEWKTHVNNSRSRAAAERMGFEQEGVFRSHFIVQGNRSRDTAWYSMLWSEWEEGKGVALERWCRSAEAKQAYERREAALLQHAELL